MTVKPNRIWSLSEDNEIATKQAWAAFLKSWGYDLDSLKFSDIDNDAKFVASDTINKLPKVSETSYLQSGATISEQTRATFTKLNGKSNYLEGVYDESVKEQPKESYEPLEKYDAALLHQCFWSGTKQITPDNDLLRFMRARKFKVGPAVGMCASCLDWKINSHPVNKWVSDGDTAIYNSKKYPQIIKAFELGKAYIRGADKASGAICVIRVKKHFGSDCPEKDFERLICLVIEWTKMTFSDYTNGNDGANILFDMTGFSLKNADLNAVKFLAKSFEANYPESLTAIWVHKAPWIFNAVWKIIKGWLDPVVASKIHFTKSTSDLEQFIDKKHIPKDLGGLDDFTPEYVPPTPSNSGKKEKDDTYQKLVAEREQLVMHFIEATKAWISATTKEESTGLLNAKIQLGAELAKNYIALDPYVRDRSCFDRSGAIGQLHI